MQEVTVQQLRQGTWHRTAYTKECYGSSSKEWDDVTKSVVQHNPLTIHALNITMAVVSSERNLITILHGVHRTRKWLLCISHQEFH